jgi:hypothetical protein
MPHGGTHSHILQPTSSGWAYPHPMSDLSLNFVNYDTVPLVYYDLMMQAVLDGLLHLKPTEVLSDLKQGQSVMSMHSPSLTRRQAVCVPGVWTPGRSTQIKPSVRFVAPATDAPEQQLLGTNSSYSQAPRAPRAYPYSDNASVGMLGVPRWLKHDELPLKVTVTKSKNINIQLGPLTPAGGQGGNDCGFCMCTLADIHVDARTILLLHIISARPSKQPLTYVHTLPVPRSYHDFQKRGNRSRHIRWW